MNAEHIIQLLQQKGFRLTAARKHVIAVLSRHTDYLGAYDIYHLLEQEKIHVGLISVYRALELLRDLGLLQSEEYSPAGERYRLLGMAEPRIHRLICTRCGQTQELKDCPVQNFTGKLELESGFRIHDHWLRFFGLCPGCQTKAAGLEPS